MGDSPPTTTSTVLLSGGLDSATALASLQERDLSPNSLFVDYGQAARAEEALAAQRIAEHFDAAHDRVDIRGLTISTGEIRGRNALLAFVGMMNVEPPATVVLGVHSGTAYWDCSREFLGRTQAIFDGYSGGGIQLMAPFAALDKAGVHQLAVSLGVDVSLTYSCELANGPCGNCPSCKDTETIAG